MPRRRFTPILFDTEIPSGGRRVLSTNHSDGEQSPDDRRLYVLLSNIGVVVVVVVVVVGGGLG